MSTPGRTALIALAGSAMGAAVVLVVVLTNPDAGASAGEVALLFAGGAALGGLLTLVRLLGRRGAQAAGRAARRRPRESDRGEIDT